MLQWSTLTLRQKLGWAVLASLSIQLLAVWMTCSSAVAMEKTWSEIFSALGVEAHIVKSDPLWGPIKMVFPKNCTMAAQLNAKIESFVHTHNLDAAMACYVARRPHVWWMADDDAVEGGARTPTSAVAAGSEATHTRVSDAPISNSTSQSRAGRRMQTSSKNLSQILIPKGKGPTKRIRMPCGKAELVVGRLNVFDRYLAMISTSTIITEFSSSEIDFAGFRHEGYRSISWFLFGCILLKYWPKIAEVQREFIGIARVSRSLFDRKLENVLLHGMSSIYCISLQITLSTCFLLIWRHDHALAIFIPKVAFRCYFWLLFIMSMLNELDKRQNWSRRHCTGNCNIVFWVLFVVPMILLLLPIIATTAWNIKFLLEIRRCSWTNGDAELVSEEFSAAAMRSQMACIIFLVQAVLEQFMFFQLDMQNLDRPGGVPVAPGVKYTYDVLETFQ
eukprot:TRINITY_DN1244_c0_g1_i3.p1 TRINITY_DN1244_c0_g1~~TRINITY_DN1244_c0_g1_i3.p1  ORF type:complete len:447 (+),score=62.97 TRINITY_DN1244_c0_g1_i3:54-1394(+)